MESLTAIQVMNSVMASLPRKGLPPLEILAQGTGIPIFLSNEAFCRMRNFSLIRPPNHLAVYGGLGEFPKKCV
jgi:hypothetical protein